MFVVNYLANIALINDLLRLGVVRPVHPPVANHRMNVTDYKARVEWSGVEWGGASRFLPEVALKAGGGGGRMRQAVSSQTA